ncbi:unnamed protein product [Sphagnum tenellum]
MVLVISILGDQSKKELSMCLPLLTEQLRNEISCLTAVKAFATIAESPLKIDLLSVLEQVVTELTTFLPKMLQGFFAELVQSANTSFKTLLESLISTTRSAVAPGGPVSKQAFYSIAQCVAVLCLADGDAECSSTVAMLATTLRTSNGTDVVNSSSGMAVNMEIC